MLQYFPLIIFLPTCINVLQWSYLTLQFLKVKPIHPFPSQIDFQFWHEISLPSLNLFIINFFSCFLIYNSVGPKTSRTSSSVACAVSPDRLPVHSVWTDAGMSPGRRSTSTRKSRTWPAECAVAMSNLPWLVLLCCLCFCYKIDTLLNQKWKILIRACWWSFCCCSSFHTHCIYNYSFLKIKAMF